MKLSADQVKFLQDVARHGVEFAAGHGALGTISLQPDQIESFTDDPDQFAANELGVSKERLHAWGEFSQGWQCLGTTKLGVRCKAMAPDGHRVGYPIDFVPSNQHCYCSKHKPS
ncbi:hypothetical protein [Pseudomonas sp. 2FE]|uniref:hypothetical protein n=1 Tax=Pseudomonas sp. 2FE TaxID=2502190 RepID=UPI0010F637FE|nr:hypothetical protein [Pseudomonas sp. 2FE]